MECWLGSGLELLFAWFIEAVCHDCLIVNTEKTLVNQSRTFKVNRVIWRPSVLNSIGISWVRPPSLLRAETDCSSRKLSGIAEPFPGISLFSFFPEWSTILCHFHHYPLIKTQPLRCEKKRRLFKRSFKCCPVPLGGKFTGFFKQIGGVLDSNYFFPGNGSETESNAVK